MFLYGKYRDPEIPMLLIPGFGINTIPGSRDPDPGIISPTAYEVPRDALFRALLTVKGCMMGYENHYS